MNICASDFNRTKLEDMDQEAKHMKRKPVAGTKRKESEREWLIVYSTCCHFKVLYDANYTLFHIFKKKVNALFKFNGSTISIQCYCSML